MTHDKQVVLITGAAGGIGLAIATRLLAQGASLALVDYDQAGLDVAAEKLNAPERVLTLSADVSSEEAVSGAVASTLERFGSITGFVSNAGVEGERGLIEEQSLKSFDRVFDINVRGVFLGLKYVLPVMKRQGKGSIVNVSSLAGITGGPGLAPYVMSKHAVIGLTRTAAAEAAASGIRVNAVLPGAVNTDMMRRIEHGADDALALKAANESATAMGRYGEPEEIASVITFLLSGEASYVTSSLYTVDGGMSPQ